MASTAMNRFIRRYPEGPWTCFFCEGEIKERGNSGDTLVIHHKNNNHADHRWENITASHHRCHSRHHRPVGTISGPNPRSRETALEVNARKIECPNGCGFVSNPGAIATHSRGWTCPEYNPPAEP